jgi:catechol 2,3-dioxygenase-like lactoylglutathione lyase family enzyme
MFRRAIPVLHVTSSTVAEQYFCGGLGFKRRFAYRPDEPKPDPCYMGLERDGVVFHISSFLGDGVSGGVATFVVDDLDGLHAELTGRRVAIEVEPTNQSWDNREMYVRDPDGNSIRFIQAKGN